MSIQADTAEFDRASVEAAVTIAARAPSIHNTQPWAWRLGPDGLMLRGDRTRQLAVADPDGHSLLVSCGAALHLTELALRAQGWRVETTVLPEPADPDALASFRAIAREEPDAQCRAETDAAMRRRSDRRPFDPKPVPPDMVEALRAAAHEPGLWADFPAQKNQMTDLAVAVSWADRVEREDPAYLEEMNRWLRDPDVHAAADGVPVGAFPHVPADCPRHTDVPLRDFEIGVAGGQLIERDVDEKPLIAVIFADGDLPKNQLLAGRAMMRLMLAADLLGLATCPLSQAVDLAAFRARVQQAMGWVGHPQMMLRVGFPGAPTSELAATPRRELSAVLEFS